jgi:hypothetical protein
VDSDLLRSALTAEGLQDGDIKFVIGDVGLLRLD